EGARTSRARRSSRPPSNSSDSVDRAIISGAAGVLRCRCLADCSAHRPPSYFLSKPRPPYRAGWLAVLERARSQRECPMTAIFRTDPEFHQVLCQILNNKFRECCVEFHIMRCMELSLAKHAWNLPATIDDINEES